MEGECAKCGRAFRLEQEALPSPSSLALPACSSELSTKRASSCGGSRNVGLNRGPKRVGEVQHIALVTVGLKTWDFFHKAFEEPNV